MADEYKRMRQLIGTTADWAANNIVIGDGEIAAERTATGAVKIKIGDGVKAYQALPYASQVDATALTAGLTGSSQTFNTITTTGALTAAGGTFTAPVALPAQGQSGATAPTANQAVTQAYTDGRYPKLTGATFTGPVALPAQTGAGSTPPTALQAVSQAYVESTYVNVAGDTMTGPLALPAQTGVGVTPPGATNAVSRAWVEAQLANPTTVPAVPAQGQTGTTAPTANQLVTQGYTDARYPQLTGATFTGAVTLPAQTGAGSTAPTALQATTQGYTEATYVNVSGDTMTGALSLPDQVTSPGGAPTANQAVTRAWVEAQPIDVSAGVADAGKVVKLSATGVIDPSMISISGGMVFKGTTDPTAAAAPTGAAQGWYYFASKDGVVGAGFPGLIGQSVKQGDSILFDGTNWHALPSDIDLTTSWRFMGTVNPNLAAPTAPAKGDVYIADRANATYNTAYGFGAMPAFLGDLVVYDGTAWRLIYGANAYATSDADVRAGVIYRHNGAWGLGRGAINKAALDTDTTMARAQWFRVLGTDATSPGANAGVVTLPVDGSTTAMFAGVGGTKPRGFVGGRATSSAATGAVTWTELAPLNQPAFVGNIGVGSNVSASSLIYSGTTASISGSTSANGIVMAPTVDSTTSTMNYRSYWAQPTVKAGVSLASIYAFQANLVAGGAGSAITTSSVGFSVDASVGTAYPNVPTAIGYSSGVQAATAAGTNRWNFYASGTAPNYMSGGLAIGTTALGNYSFVVDKGMTGADTVTLARFSGIVKSDVTKLARLVATYAGAEAATFTAARVEHFSAIQGSFGTGSTVTEQIGFIANGSMATGMTNIGFQSDLNVAAAGRTHWAFYGKGTAASHFGGPVSVTGDVTAKGTVLTSDERLKTNVEDTGSQLADVMKYRVRHYTWRSDESSKKMLGLIAQEVRDVSPGLVHAGADAETGDEVLSIRLDPLVFKMLKAMQEQQATIEALTARVAALEAK